MNYNCYNNKNRKYSKHVWIIGKLIDYIAGLQQEDGSFAGDCWGEIDTSIFRKKNKVICLNILLLF